MGLNGGKATKKDLPWLTLSLTLPSKALWTRGETPSEDSGGYKSWSLWQFQKVKRVSSMRAIATSTLTRIPTSSMFTSGLGVSAAGSAALAAVPPLPTAAAKQQLTAASACASLEVPQHKEESEGSMGRRSTVACRARRLCSP